jgi:hypothetical protein
MEKDQMMKILKNDIYFSDIIDQMRDSFYDILSKYSIKESDEKIISDFINELKIEIN